MPATTGGLAPFDEPVYLERTVVDPDIGAPPDGAPRPVIAFVCRACLLAALAAAAPFLVDDGPPAALAVLIGVQLPVTTLIDFRRARPGSPAMALAGTTVVFDIASVVAFAVVVERLSLLLAVGLLLIAFHRWQYGRIAGTLSVALATGSLLALHLSDRLDGDWFDVAALGGVGVLLVWLVDDQATRHFATSQGLQLVSNRAVAIVEGIGDAIVSTDATGHVTAVNPSASRMLGVGADRALGQRCEYALALQSDGRPLSCEGGCPLLGDESSVEVARTGPQGNRQPLLASAVALYDARGDAVEVVHLLRDITSIKAAEEAKTLFLATASHELKTPLAVIRGYSQLLQMIDMDPEERKTALRSIEDRSGQLVGIVDRLLMSSRIEAGRIDLLPELGPVEAVIRNRTDDFARTFRSVEVEIEPDLPDAVCDPAALATVVDHLLENADKYTPRGGAIGVTVHHEDAHVVLRVADEGIGMTDEQRARCFDRFWQAEGTDVRRFGGTGIGLYIVRSLVEAMQGSVTVDGNDAGGTTFTVSLPCAPADGSRPQSRPVNGEHVEGEESMIREFMRQVGVLDEGASRSRA